MFQARVCLGAAFVHGFSYIVHRATLGIQCLGAAFESRFRSDDFMCECSMIVHSLITDPALG